ncbi:MAG: hypothetical protein OXP36_04455, partial [Gammaproteobacteria bacterium]|nr:hypothetical protein [Gammaproteobacteria bacterium]
EFVQVLDGDRDAVEWPKWRAFHHFPLGLSGSVEERITGLVGEGVDATVVFADALEKCLGEFEGGQFPGPDARR